MIRYYLYICFFSLFLSYPLTLNAQSSNKVIAIKIEGLQKISLEIIQSIIQIKVGDVIDLEKINSDLKILWEKDFFNDIRILQEQSSKGITLVFVFKEKPSIINITYKGYDNISKTDIEEVVDLKPLSILSLKSLKNNIEKIKNLYIEQGYYLVEVISHIKNRKTGSHEVDIVFEILEKIQVQVKQITFVGNYSISSEELKSKIQTREGSDLSWITQSGIYKEDFFQTDLLRLQAYYYNFGFITVKINKPIVTISNDKKYIFIRIPIEEGLKYKVGDVQFSGEVHLKNEKDKVVLDEKLLKKTFSLQKNDIFNRQTLFESIQKMTDLYRNYGYAYTNIVPDSKIHKEDKKVDIDFQIDIGEKIYIESIEIVGNTSTRDKVVRRELIIYEGELFSARKINISQARIYQLGFFELATISQEQGSSPNKIKLIVEVKEKRTGTFQLGAGLSSVENFIFTAQISQNNFLGYGQTVSLSTQLSFGDNSRKIASLSFFEPYFLETPFSLESRIFHTQNLYYDYERKSTGISFNLGYPIIHKLRVYTGYSIEKSEITSGSITNNLAYSNINRSGLKSSINASINYDTRNNRLIPSSGHYHSLYAEISERLLGSDEDLLYRRLKWVSRYYYPLPLSMTLKFNTSIGLVFSINDIGVPINERFSPGGIFSIRGFRFRTLGATRRVLTESEPLNSSQSITIGGNKEFIFNMELEFPIVKVANITGVFFFDAGNAYDDHENIFYINTPNKPSAYLLRSGKEISPPLGLYYSLGFGFRWFSPLGPLRFEWGIPITKRYRDDDGFLFEFTIGNFF